MLFRSLIKQADGGTLFLDEVGELTPAAQKAFLRVLQERCFRPVGGKREIKSDFRLIAATNRDLNRMVREGQFREDLLFRLRAFTIELPPLRNRPVDIRELSFHYVNKLCTRYKKEIKGFSPEFLDALCAYEWPGNVRELVNALESALAVASSEPILFPKHLPMHVRIHLIRDAIHEKGDTVLSREAMGTLKERRESAVAYEEDKYLRELMVATGGSISKACEISGLSRIRLYVLLKKYSIIRKSPPVVS